MLHFVNNRVHVLASCIGNECDLITCCLKHCHAPSLAGVRTGPQDKKSSTMLRPTYISLVSSLSLCAREVHVGKVAYWLRVEREGLKGWGTRVAIAWLAVYYNDGLCLGSASTVLPVCGKVNIPLQRSRHRYSTLLSGHGSIHTGVTWCPPWWPGWHSPLRVCLFSLRPTWPPSHNRSSSTSSTLLDYQIDPITLATV